MAKFAVILPAAGRSSRFHDKNYKKPFAPLANKAVWLHSAERFVNRSDVKQILIVISPEDMEYFQFKFSANTTILGIDVVEGGAERADSVAKALARVKADIDFVCIHDAARPCLADEWISQVFAAAEKTDAAICAIPVQGTLKRVGADHKIEETVSRTGLWEAQTPQVFRRQLLLEAHAKRGDFPATDDAQLVERIGHAVTVVAGSPINLKIASREDLRLAEQALKVLPKPKLSGSAHPFADDDMWRVAAPPPKERTPLNDIIAELGWRGLIHQSTDDKLAGWLNAESRTVYAGFDPTADSLHVGHLMGLMVLRRFQRAGHRPIALVGGATGMIGDPSGKSEERNLLSVDELRANVAAIELQMRNVLDFDTSPIGGILANNFEWMSGFGYLEFLRDIGKNFPVNVMLAKDSVKSRLERGDAGMSYTEFSYMLLQAYDFVHLHDTFGCELQVGGSDQWGNITAGIDLARRMRGAQLYGITWPLLTKSDGSKMGKTESGAVWLSPERTSPYAFYQYWINVDDADAGKCLRFLTELEREEVEVARCIARGRAGQARKPKAAGRGTDAADPR